ncbi:putative sister chromatid cohesion protein Dcc1 [Helianthus anomalus]
MDRMLTSLLWAAHKHRWSLSSLYIYEVAKVLMDQGYSQDVVCHCLTLFATTTDDGRFWELETERVNVRFALHTLSCYEKMTLEAFPTNWVNMGIPS